jgi:hypothetical protein
LAATAPGRLRLQNKRKAKLVELGFGASFDTYALCNPRWTPKYSILDHTQESITYVPGVQQERFVVRYLQSLGVRPQHAENIDFHTLLKDMNWSTSAGFGFTQKYQHKHHMIPSLMVNPFHGYKEWYSTLPDGEFTLDPTTLNPNWIIDVKVKEEISKRTKIEKQDYRTFFCVPVEGIVEGKLQQEACNRLLTSRGFMFKGEENRSEMTWLWKRLISNIADGAVVYQFDASKLDRTLPRSVISSCFTVRDLLGFKTEEDYKFFSLHPVVHYIVDGESRFVKLKRPQVSGRDSTTEDDLLALFLIMAKPLIAAGYEPKDIYITGVGDDVTLVLKEDRGVTCDDFIECFAEAGVTMKCWQVREPKDFDFLGASIRVCTDGVPRPYWNIGKITCKLAYSPKRETAFEYLLRVLSACSYVYYHPEFIKLEEYYQWSYEGLKNKLTVSEVDTLEELYHDIGNYYVRLQGGSNLNEMGKGKKSKSKSKPAAKPAASNKGRGNPKKRPQNRRPRPQAGGRVGNVLSHMSMCDREYVKALANPFDPSVFGKVCVPVFPSRPSYKFTMRKTLTMTTGTTGYGFFAFEPCIAKDIKTGYYTDAAYTGGGVVYTAGTGVTELKFTELPFIATQMGFPQDVTVATCQARVICAGARIRYIGKEADLSGMVYTYVDPDQRAIASGLSQNDLPAAIQRKTPVSRNWNEMTIVPIHMDDLEFYPKSQETGADSFTTKIYHPFSDIQGDNTRPYAYFQVKAHAGASFDIEVVQHLEFVGSAVSQSYTPSHIGDGKVVNAALNAAQATVNSSADTLGATEKTFAQVFMDGVSEFLTPGNVGKGVQFASKIYNMASGHGTMDGFDPAAGFERMMIDDVARG